MKMIPDKYVYARVGAPSTEVPFSGYRNPGEVLTIDDFATGSTISGNSVWYHCADDGCYYWSGAFPLTSELLVLPANAKGHTPQEMNAVYQSAANELAGQYFHIRGFKGIGAGYKVIEKENKTTEDIVLIFYVSHKLEDANAAIPPIIHYRGFALKTDVRVTTAARLQAEDPDRVLPYQMGGSIATLAKENSGYIEVASGSRTLLITQQKKELLLACYHVACNALFEKKIYTYKENEALLNIPSQTKSPGSRTVRGKVTEGRFGNGYDYALIETDVDKFINLMPGYYFNDYYKLAEISNLTSEMLFIKYGAKTQEGRGYFKGYPINNLELNDGKHRMSGLVKVDKMSEEGDSGAPVIDHRHKFLGLIVAGDSDYSYVLPIAQLTADFYFTPNL